jgi:hypothetical protein
MQSKDYMQLLANEYDNKELSKDDLISTLKHYAELYHEEQTIKTNKPMQQPINYCDIMALGFTAEDGHDSVFEKMHGYPYTIFTKMLAPTLMLDWQQTTRLCEVLVIRPEDGHIYQRIPVIDTNSLQTLVNSFKKPEADTCYAAC